MQVLKQFFQQCARDGYSDQFQCRHALPTDQPSLVSDIRANPEPCNLQYLEIDQGIERSDGQSWKDCVDVPTHTPKKKKTPPSDGEKSAKLFRNARKPRFIFSFLLSFFFRNEQEDASSTVHSFALLKDNELPVPMAFALASSSSLVLNSMQSTHETHN